MDILQKNRTLLIVEGIIFTLLGVLAVALPGLSTLSMELFIGWLFILGGLFQGYRSIKSIHSKGAVLSLIVALIYLAFGIYLLAYPLAGIISLTLVLTFFFIMEGITKIILGIQMRPLNQWGWFVISGLIALAMAYIIYAGWPETAFWVIGLLVGINMIFFGLTLLFFGINLPKGTDKGIEKENDKDII